MSSDYASCMTKLDRMPDVAIVSDGNGGSARLISTGLLRCDCKNCHAVFFTEVSQPKWCPMCRGDNLAMTWTRPQTALVPEMEADFLHHKKK